MRTISADTVLRMREILTLLSIRPVTIDEIVEKTTIPNSTSTHKLLARLSNDYGFKIVVDKRRRKLDKCGTRFGVYSLCPTQADRLKRITDEELGKRESLASLPVRIKKLLDGGYSIDYISSKLDKTRSCIIYHASKNGLNASVKRDKSTPTKPVVTENDKITIYMKRPKSLI